MKQSKTRILALLMLFVLALSLSIPVGAANIPELYSSTYFRYDGSSASAQGNGVVNIKCKIYATHSMTELGASKVVVYKVSSNGSASPVHTYTRNTTPSLIKKNVSIAETNLSYQGSTGTKYYAVITYYAKDADGSETWVRTTSTVTAR